MPLKDEVAWVRANLDSLKLTATQVECLELVEEHGGLRPAAVAAGVAYGSMSDRWARVRARAALAGYSPSSSASSIPAPYVARGTSTLYDRHGRATQTWVKTRLDDERREAMIREAIEAAMEDIPRLPALPCPAPLDNRDLTVYPVTDFHWGMLSWPKETGERWDLDEADRVFDRAISSLVSRQNARSGLLAMMGDQLHQDGMSPVTPTSHHVLDSDSRYPRTISRVIRAVRGAVDKLLLAHEDVTVVVIAGNHDLSASHWLREVLAALYESEPRCTVPFIASPFWCGRHGSTLVAFHHGHGRRVRDLDRSIASLYPEIWGMTKHRYGHTGHLHHERSYDNGGLIAEQHPTLAARDAYASNLGLWSRRSMAAITYSPEHGEVSRVQVVPGALK